MAWWDDILGLLKDEYRSGAGIDAEEPPSVRQAQALLKRTARELSAAQARAEAARRRMLRAQGELEALTRDATQHPRYRDRLTELARAIAHESEMIGSFDAHIASLSAMQARVQEQMRGLDRDLSMSRSASAAARTTRAVAPSSSNAAPDPSTPPGFRRARSERVIDELRQIPSKRKRDHED